ncbi:MAG: very short patch repair endonuclease, partial [Pseudomonadota bacterium]|nr:very short patch repair endonuclease [Pseudomonadota bacterium]
MVDTVDTTTRSRMMASIKGKDTVPEMFVRRAIHAQGFRYRLGGGGLPGRPDLIFPSM